MLLHLVDLGGRRGESASHLWPGALTVTPELPRMLRLVLEYDGSAYRGWQRQPGALTVEGALLQALQAVTGEQPRLTAAGRTDAGAHAHGQVVGLALQRGWQPERLRRALNAVLPQDVYVIAAAEAPLGFHARYDALARAYRYVVVPRRDRLAVARQYAWQVRGELDLAAMRHAAPMLEGRHDFAGFGSSPRPGGATVRTVQRITVRTAPLVVDRETAQAVIIEVVADAFLYGMMRSIAGMLVAVGTGRLGDRDVEALLRAPHSTRRPTLAPAHGLHQWTVIYPDPTTDDEEEA